MNLTVTELCGLPSDELKASLCVKDRDIRARTLIRTEESAQKDSKNSSHVPLEIRVTSRLHFVGLEYQCCALAMKVVKRAI